MDQQGPSRQISRRTRLLIFCEYLGLMVLWVLAALGVGVAGQLLVPAGVFVVLLTSLQVLLTLRS